MELSKKDRLILSNQYRLLEKLYPDEAERLAVARRAIEAGYELHYEEFAPHLRHPLSAEQCLWVIEVLEMFQALARAYDALPDPAGIDERGVRFAGFDGKKETEYLEYARYLLRDLKRYTELRVAADDCDSRVPTLSRYQVMLAEWRRCKDRRALSRDDVARITGA